MRYLLTILNVSLLFSQARIGDWQSFTSPLEINQIVEKNNQLICATNGGLLLYNIEQAGFDNINNINEIGGTRINTIALQNESELWVGGGEPEGFVQIYDIENMRSIKQFEYELSEIIDFAVGDSIVYAAFRDKNDYGIIEYSLLNDEFIHKDLYPNWPNGGKILGIELYENTVYTATDKGLFVGEIGQDPHNWKKLFQELSESEILLYKQAENLYCYSDMSLYLIDLSNSKIRLIKTFPGYEFIDFIVKLNGTINTFDNNYFYNIDENGNITELLTLNNSANTLNILSNSKIVLGTTTGLAFYDTYNSDFNYTIPNAPLTNSFQAITLLDDGRLVGGSKFGLAIKEQDGWRNIVESESEIVVQQNRDYANFIADSIPIDFGSSIAKLEQGPDGLLYCAIEGTYPYPRRNGGGVVIIDIDNPVNFTLIDTTYLDYFADEFMVVKDLDFDRSGNLWVADPFANTKHEPLHVKSPGGEWKAYNAEDASHIVSLTPSAVAIDAWQRVWVGSFQSSARNTGFQNGGLAMLSYTGDPTQPDDFQWHKIDINVENSTNTILSLAVTKENRLFILTPTGLTYLDLQYSNDDPIRTLNKHPKFPNISFGSEAKVRTDANNNAWAISGSDGIHVLLNNSNTWPSGDSTEVKSINTEDYPLLSNNVTDIVFDDASGVAYIATDRGINRFRIPFANAKENYSALRIFPSPFHIPSDKPLIIDGLKDNSSVKVMTITGKVICDLRTEDMGIHGNQIEWDGRNDREELVGSGVYLFSVYDPNGAYKFGKLAVIKH